MPAWQHARPGGPRGESPATAAVGTLPPLAPARSSGRPPPLVVVCASVHLSPPASGIYALPILGWGLRNVRQASRPSHSLSWNCHGGSNKRSPQQKAVFCAASFPDRSNCVQDRMVPVSGRAQPSPAILAQVASRSSAAAALLRATTREQPGVPTTAQDWPRGAKPLAAAPLPGKNAQPCPGGRPRRTRLPVWLCCRPDRLPLGRLGLPSPG